MEWDNGSIRIALAPSPSGEDKGRDEEDDRGLARDSNAQAN